MSNTKMRMKFATAYPKESLAIVNKVFYVRGLG